MSSMKRKLRLIGAFAVLATLALAISCRGFFVNPTLTSITIAPTTPEVEINNIEALTVYGNYNDGSTGQVTSGVSWSSSTPSVASFSSPTSNVLHGLTLGTTTITANAQAVTATATATVFLGGITAMTVSPTTASQPLSFTTQDFTFTADANGTEVPITTDNGGTLTITPATTGITCIASGNMESCTGDGSETAATYSLTMTYPGTAISATAKLTVQ